MSLLGRLAVLGACDATCASLFPQQPSLMGSCESGFRSGQVYTGLERYIQGCKGIFRRRGIYRSNEVCTGVQTYIQDYRGIYRSIEEDTDYRGIYGNTEVFTGV